jgi:hypothetical protein
LVVSWLADFRWPSLSYYLLGWMGCCVLFVLLLCCCVCCVVVVCVVCCCCCDMFVVFVMFFLCYIVACCCVLLLLCVLCGCESLQTALGDSWLSLAFRQHWLSKPFEGYCLNICLQYVYVFRSLSVCMCISLSFVVSCIPRFECCLQLPPTSTHACTSSLGCT